MNTYQTPKIELLGSFHELTNAGIGTSAEGWFPLADRSS